MDLMDEGTQVSFLWRLVNATRSGNLTWDEVNEYHFRTRIGRFGYSILSDDSDDYAPYSMGVYRFVEPEAQPVSIATWEWDRNHQSATNDALASLYTEVKRAVLGLDTTVADMLEDLAKVDGDSPEIPETH